MTDKKDFAVIITGSRTWTDVKAIRQDLRSLQQRYNLSVVVGDARGADAITSDQCVRLAIPCQVYKADWNQFGKRAGYLRNMALVNSKPKAGGVLAYQINNSVGTQHCIDLAKARSIPTKIRSMDMEIVEPKKELSNHDQALLSRLDRLDAPLAYRVASQIIGKLHLSHHIPSDTAKALLSGLMREYRKAYRLRMDAMMQDEKALCEGWVISDNPRSSDATTMAVKEPIREPVLNLKEAPPSGKQPVIPTIHTSVRAWTLYNDTRELWQVFTDKADIKIAYGLEPQDDLPCRSVQLYAEEIKYGWLNTALTRKLQPILPAGFTLYLNPLDPIPPVDSIDDDFEAHGLELVNIDDVNQNDDAYLEKLDEYSASLVG